MSALVDELAKYLRMVASKRLCDRDMKWVDDPKLLEAAAELTTLQSRLEAVKAERDVLAAEEVEWKEAVQGEYKRAEHHKAKRAAAEARVEELQKALAFADEQAKKLEALLEPHIKWDPGSDVSKGGEE
jgi:seryl-tRNA synthetase